VSPLAGERPTAPTTLNWVTHDDQVGGFAPEFEVRYGTLSNLLKQRNFRTSLCLGRFFDTPAMDDLPNPLASNAQAPRVIVS